MDEFQTESGSLPSFEGSGLKCSGNDKSIFAGMSSLIRGKWIEISILVSINTTKKSSLIRGKWIEMRCKNKDRIKQRMSSLIRGKWIEMALRCPSITWIPVFPHSREVD